MPGVTSALDELPISDYRRRMPLLCCFLMHANQQRTLTCTSCNPTRLAFEKPLCR